MQDINYTLGNERFNFRVGAFVTCKGRILLQTAEGRDFWNLIGGRVKLGESTEEAVKREIREEIGLVNVDCKLIHISENFFNWMGVDVHELLFIYKVELDDKYFDILENSRVLDNDTESIRWFGDAEVKMLNCKPRIIYDLLNGTTGIQYKVNRD